VDTLLIRVYLQGLTPSCGISADPSAGAQAMRLLLQVALIAQVSCLCTCRHLTDAGENSSKLVYVATAEKFVEALEKGVRHVVVTEHLDLSVYSRLLSTSTGGVAETSTTATVQVPLCSFLKARPCAIWCDDVGGEFSWSVQAIWPCGSHNSESDIAVP
jgi:hypothetical protein